MERKQKAEVGITRGQSCFIACLHLCLLHVGEVAMPKLLLRRCLTRNLGKAKGGSFRKHKKETYRKWLCNTHLTLLSFDFSFEISTFSLLFF